jgi:hemolysin activation/secretion protein
VLQLLAWHVYGFVEVNNVGPSIVGPWQSYATGTFASYLTLGDIDALFAQSSCESGSTFQADTYRLNCNAVLAERASDPLTSFNGGVWSPFSSRAAWLELHRRFTLNAN